MNLATARDDLASAVLAVPLYGSAPQRHLGWLATSTVVMAALERGLWVYPAGSGPVANAIMVAPPFVVTEAPTRVHTGDLTGQKFGQYEIGAQLGLADKMGSLDKIAREVVKAEDVIDYTVKENIAERLAKRFGAAMGAGAVQAMRSSITVR